MIITGQGFVLAGGKSSRMGANKALLTYQGRTFLDRSIGVLQSMGLEVRVITHARFPRASLKVPVPILIDRITEAGPLGGIFTALDASSSNDNYFLPCDTPFMERRFFDLLSGFTQGFDAVVGRDSRGRTHPLCGYYSRCCLAPIQQLLEKGERRVNAILETKKISSRILSAPELGIPDFFFFNVNTPEDLSSLGSH